MRKLKLDVESLEVQSFPLDEEPKVRGTVEAHDDSIGTTYGPWFCPYYCECDSAPSC